MPHVDGRDPGRGPTFWHLHRRRFCVFHRGMRANRRIEHMPLDSCIIRGHKCEYIYSTKIEMDTSK